MERIRDRHLRATPVNENGSSSWGQAAGNGPLWLRYKRDVDAILGKTPLAKALDTSTCIRASPFVRRAYGMCPGTFAVKPLPTADPAGWTNVFGAFSASDVGVRG